MVEQRLLISGIYLILDSWVCYSIAPFKLLTRLCGLMLHIREEQKKTQVISKNNSREEAEPLEIGGRVMFWRDWPQWHLGRGYLCLPECLPSPILSTVFLCYELTGSSKKQLNTTFQSWVAVVGVNLWKNVSLLMYRYYGELKDGRWPGVWGVVRESSVDLISERNPATFHPVTIFSLVSLDFSFIIRQKPCPSHLANVSRRGNKIVPGREEMCSKCRFLSPPSCRKSTFMLHAVKIFMIF